MKSPHSLQTERCASGRGDANLAAPDVKALAQPYVVQAVAVLVKGMRSRSATVRVQSAKTLLDRIYGKVVAVPEVAAQQQVTYMVHPADLKV